MSAQSDDIAPPSGLGTPGGATSGGQAHELRLAAQAPSVWNVANVLTILRIVIIPLFLVALFADGGHDRTWRVAAAGLFMLAAITDRIDGQVARKYGLVTDFGKLADPIADKALIGAALVGLSMLGELPWWITIVIWVREVGITLMRFAVIRRGVIAANRGGKLKTLVQAVAIVFYVLGFSGVFATIGHLLMYLAVVLTVATGIDYLVSVLRPRRTA